MIPTETNRGIDPVIIQTKHTKHSDQTQRTFRSTT